MKLERKIAETLEPVQIIGSRTHGMMDYPMGALMMSAPLLFTMDKKEIATWIPVAVGASMAAMALMTNFEAGVKRKIPFRTHLIVDAISGIALAASPWLIKSRNRRWVPHLLFGLGELVTTIMTRPKLDSQSESRTQSTGSRRTKSRRASERSTSNRSSAATSTRSRRTNRGGAESASTGTRRRSRATETA